MAAVYNSLPNQTLPWGIRMRRTGPRPGGANGGNDMQAASDLTSLGRQEGTYPVLWPWPRRKPPTHPGPGRASHSYFRLTCGPSDSPGQEPPLASRAADCRMIPCAPESQLSLTDVWLLLKV